jgi:hypothetical protein
MKTTSDPFPIFHPDQVKFREWQEELYTDYGASLISPALDTARQLDVTYKTDKDTFVLHLSQLRVLNSQHSQYGVTPLSINYAILFYPEDNDAPETEELDPMEGMVDMKTLVYQQLAPFFTQHGTRVLRSGVAFNTMRLERAFAVLQSKLIDLDSYCLGAIERRPEMMKGGTNPNFLLLNFLLKAHVEANPDNLPLMMRLRVYLPSSH